MRSISFIPFLVLLASPAFGWPVRRTYGTEPANSAVNSHNSYSGAGGNAPGGSVQAPGPSGPLDILRGGLLNIGSNNAGNAGNASSGPATAGGILSSGRSTDSVNSGGSYSGQGGQAPGGNVNVTPGLVNIDSNDAGDGGPATSSSSGSGGI
ncbi:hypothetical protein AGABI1DRAFT_123753 [Agaricus bisporus var. burnettii JB137-S8]|uniref:Uncharacterized protein n=2 Tax=Agaricus bisporus var. burnettii TaxID=192524 RepID=K5X6B1_AGABU|nr:uncharacterized protein AGABI1DRAFT_123753 [Agaricus bisporus var. burnettii JB137-S8]EKM83421.1 hypothetical protein AGABI1DRAFT_123753 [Agaricus bisporus var. burnettii JB137-S8]KAF7784752.1 hypothetical protein Agabi119p4_917 [Agaricus bisporus var. burnettii]